MIDCLFHPERDAVERQPGFNPTTKLTFSSGSGSSSNNSSSKRVAASDDPELDEIAEIMQERSPTASKETPKPSPKPPSSATGRKKGGAKSAGDGDDGGGFNLFGFDAMEASAAASGEQQVVFLPIMNCFVFVPCPS